MNEKFFAAIRYGHDDTVKRLIKTATTSDIEQGLRIAIHRLSVFKALLTAGATPDDELLDLALRKGYANVAAVMIAVGCNIKDGTDLLCNAIEKSHREVITLLLSDNEVFDFNRVLDVAISYGRDDLIPICISKGAQITSSLLMMACTPAKRSVETMKAVLSATDIPIEWTHVECAIEHRNYETALLLIGFFSCTDDRVKQLLKENHPIDFLLCLH